MAEVDEIIQAMEEWVERHPTPDEPILHIGNGTECKSYSPRQILNEMKQGTEFGRRKKEEIIKTVIEFLLGATSPSSTM
jgi:hypothetical protein